MARYTSIPRFFFLCASLLMFAISGCGNKSNNNGGSGSCTTRDDCAAGERCSSGGVCTTSSDTCEYNSDCGVDEYCANGSCELRACSDDDDCVAGSICLADQCLVGCRENSDCPNGESCSSTNICEVAGCTTNSCPQFQSCDDNATPPTCVYTGDCSNDAHCAGYAQLVDDGNEYICSQAEQRCVIKPPCDGDADCQVGDICEPRATDGRRVCRSGCRSNDSCRTGYICDLTNLACSPGCASVEDCPSDGANYACEDFVCVTTCETRNECGTGQVCAGNPRRCQACSDDSECPANEFCNKELGSTDQEIENAALGLCAALPPTCPDDGYGNNHNQNVAYAVTTPFDTASEQPLFCRENSGGEWFSFSAASGDVIEVRLNYDNSFGNLDIGLRREAGDELVASQNPPTIDQGEELIRFGVDLGGTFLVHVRGTLISANANYDLAIDVNPAPACTDDALEPNSSASPAVLPVDTDHLGLEACGDDADFYTLNVAQNQVVTINVESPAALGNVDIYLRDPSGTQVASSVTRQDKETIDVALGDAGAYVLEVRSGVGAVKYDLAWTQRDNNCADPFEPNDMCPSNPIDAGSYTGLNVCADNDWYSVELLPLQTITVTATYDRAVSAGDLDLTLIGPNDCATLSAIGTETTIAGTTQVQERMQYQSESGGTYNIQVFLFSGVQAEYDLTVDVSNGPPCVDDEYEPNDNQAGATTLDRAQLAAGTDNVLAGLRVCDVNEDWYRVDLEVGDEIEFQVQFEHARGDLDAELIGPTGVVATASSETDDETLSYTVGAGEAGAYYLKIAAKFAARNDYWVLTFLNGAGPVDTACPDQFENNDTRDQAVPIAPGNYGLLVCGAPVDEDWYSIALLAGERLELGISTDGGDAELFLFDDTGSTAPVAQATTSGTGAINYTSYRDQTMVIRVRESVGQARVPYNLAVTKFGVPPCVDDRFSGNTSSDLAAQVAIPGLYGRMMLCDGTTDWYAINVSAGRASEVFLNFDGTRADLDLAVYSPTMAVIEASTVTGSDESIEFTPSVTGTHYIAVTGKANARLNYDLLLYTDTDGDGIPEGPEDRVCPDIFENNDTIATAVQVPPGTYADLLICSPLDNDYYRVFVPAGATLTAIANFSHALGNIDVELRSGTAPFTVLSDSKTTNDTEVVEFENTGGDQFVIVAVLGATGSGVFSNYYELDLDLEFADMCVDDTNSGRTLPTAVTLTPGAYEMQMCEGTQDFIALGNITSVEAHIEFKHDFGDLDMVLLDSGTNTVVSNGVGNTESIVASGLSGQHYLMIAPKGGAFIRNDYDLWLSINGVEPTVPYCPDRFERNDTQALASAIPLSQTQRQVAGLIACGTEEDWYITSNLAGTTFNLAMFYDHGPGSDLDIAMWPLSADPATDTPTVLIDTAGDDALSSVTLTSGQHYIRVRNTATNGVETPYDLLLGVPSMYGAAGCPEDALEPNNNSSSAKPLGFPAAVALGLCGNDDHFKFVAPTAGPVTVSIAFDASQFNAGLRVLDGNLNNVGFSFDDVGNRESVTFNATAGAEYYVEVQQSGGTTENGPYFLRIQ